MNFALNRRSYGRAVIAVAVTLAVVACSANGTGASNTVTSASVPSMPQVTLSVSPQSLQDSESATITWSSVNATSCVASGAWSGPQALSNSSGISTGAKVAGTHSYGLTCTGPGGSGSAVQELNVGTISAPELSLQLEPSSVRPGDTAILKWTSVNASACMGSGGTGSDGWNGTRAASETQGLSVGPFASAGTYSYSLECTGVGGSSSDNRILTVDSAASPPAPAITIATTPARIQPGESASLAWNVLHADACVASGGTGNDGWSGNKALSSGGNTLGPINSPGSYSYILTCTGPGGSISSSTILVVSSSTLSGAAAIEITIDPAVITAGTSAAISWNSSNITSCEASGSWNGAKAVVGSGVTTGVLTTPGNYSYTLTCAGPTGSVTDTASLTVNSPPATLQSFAATPANVQVGQSTVLSWSSLNADSCVASGGTGSDGWSGAKSAASASTQMGPFVSPGTVTYSLACSGSGGSSGIQSVSVTVAAVTPPASVVSLDATPNSILVGESLTLNWSTANATSCVASGGTGADGWSGAVATSGAGVSIGPINVAGNYTYSLTCNGPGGVGSVANVSVSVGAGAPPASIVSLNASPTTVAIGQSTTLSWSSANATSCTASNGAGGDGWSGSVATSSAGTVVGPIAVAGSYTYSLVCVGPGGTSGLKSVVVDVPPATPPASITGLAASPNSIQVGQSALISWSSINATACTASGGAGGDNWGGSVASSSAGASVGPIQAAGTHTYTLTCSGPGGASSPSSVTIVASPAPSGPPSITLSANDANPAQIQPGQSLTLKWSTTNATSCSASGGTGTDGWSSTQPSVSAGHLIGVLATPGIYTYSLTCSGPGGSSSSSVAVTVMSTASADCGIGVPSTALLAPAASVSSAVNGVCLLGCSVSNAARVIDSDLDNFATMNVGIGVLAYDSIRVTDGTTSYPAGRKAGFLISEPGQLLSLGVLNNVTVRTLLNGTPQESATAATILELSALGSQADPAAGFVGFATTKPFNAVRIDVGSLAAVSTTMRVYGACVTL